jgi:hypothetical protein
MAKNDVVECPVAKIPEIFSWRARASQKAIGPVLVQKLYSSVVLHHTLPPQSPQSSLTSKHTATEG